MRAAGRAFATPADDGGASTTHFGFNEIPKEDKKAKVRELFDKVRRLRISSLPLPHSDGSDAARRFRTSTT